MIGRTLSHYRIEDPLGAGGMGVVYRARDLALGCDVALKVLPEGFAPEMRERLMREARAGADLRHPAIAAFHDAGEDDGVAWMALEFVRGRTLRQALVTDPPSPARAIAVAGALLEALAHAHARGVLHRDVKPENVMLADDGAVKLLDFGLARRMTPEDAGADRATLTLITSAGAITGTPGYLAPEQIRGDEVDARADLFAVGALLYECLAGAPAFPGAAPMARLGATLSRPVDPLPEGFHPGLAAILDAALASDPALRPASAGQFLATLKALPAAIAPPRVAQALAIVPFASGTAPDQAWVASALAESIGGELTGRDRARLVPRARVRALVAAAEVGRDPGAPVDPLTIGLRLGCGATLSGSTRTDGATLTTAIRLIEVPTGRLLMAREYSGPLEAIEAQACQMAQGVATACGFGAVATGRATGARHDPGAGSAARLKAIEISLRARRFAGRPDAASFDAARAAWLEALAADPAYPPALVGLARLLARRFLRATDPADRLEAERLARTAAAADPSFIDAPLVLGRLLTIAGRPVEALGLLERAAMIDPASHRAAYHRARAAHAARRRDLAVRLYQEAIALEPQVGGAWLGLGQAHLELGRLDEARYCFGRAERIEAPGGPESTAGAAGFLGEALRRLGRTAEAGAACRRGIAAAERSEAMQHDTYLAAGLLTLGRLALRQSDTAAARAAFGRAATHLAERPRTYAGGALRVQALAGLAQCDPEGAARLDEARDLLDRRGGADGRGPDFSWFWGATDETALLEMARAARALGRAADATALLRRADEAGREMA